MFAGGDGVGRDLIGVGMRGVDHRFRCVLLQPCHETIRTAEAADPRGNGLRFRCAVRPARETVASKRRSAASRRVSSEASVVPPRMRTRIEISSMSAEPATCTEKRWLSIIGIGEDGVEGLGSVARQLIE